VVVGRVIKADLLAASKGHGESACELRMTITIDELAVCSNTNRALYPVS